jgi:hypothetical protein
MTPKNVAVTYEVVVRYGLFVTDSDLDAAISALDKNEIPKRLCSVVRDAIEAIPGLAIEVYEDGLSAPAASAVTVPFRGRNAS